ncbi:LuxR C-terminal-related transcriptional regulator [Mycobacterium spongiae]|nr:LuxR C-terminal-related transcriptional regulator [Mycobacterium spongiae]
MPVQLAVARRAHEASEVDDLGRRAHETAARLSRALTAARDLVDVPAWAPSMPGRLLAEVGEYTDVVIDRLLGKMRSNQAASSELIAMCELVVELQRCRSEQQLIMADERIRILTAAQRSDSMLGSQLDVDAVLERAAAVACRVCGLDRSMIFRMGNGYLHAASTYFTDHDEWAAQCHAHAEVHPVDLSARPLEAEMVRRRLPALMTDTLHDPQAFKPIVHRIRTSSYVAIPVLVNGKVTVTLHLDAYFRGREVDAGDRDTAAVFASSLGRALERAFTAEQLRSQRAALSELIRDTNRDLAMLAGESTVLTDASPTACATTTEPHRWVGTPATSVRQIGHQALASLTRREMEVLELMTTGATNVEIAQRFFVAEGTVKTHVKRILRKLNVGNRGQAVAMYHRCTSR